ncbi:hypothetical protein GCM10027442_52840 [Emticicia fontis]
MIHNLLYFNDTKLCKKLKSRKVESVAGEIGFVDGSIRQKDGEIIKATHKSSFYYKNDRLFTLS